MPANVVIIVFDDLGFAQLGCFGSDVETPHIDRLAEGGLRYNRFHVTALCSPTRAALLTGRNHHAVGMGFLADIPFDLPGYRAHRPATAAPLPRLLRDAGYATVAVGKWHLVPGGERTHAGPFTEWPLGWGFESFYGFLQGDTNQWTPNLVRDNHYVEAPRSPDEGYHLSEDLADEAIRQVLDRRQSAPGKPFFLYLALGAMHSPHQVPPGWAARYAGRFDGGWDAWRRRAYEKQLSTGVIPPGTALTPRPPWVAEWEGLPADARRLFSRMFETYAGFLTHADAQVGRVLDALAAMGALDDTVVVLLSDNGASAEGGEMGTFDEHRFTARSGETVEGNLRYYDQWGGHRTYSHYSWGWAWAGNAPFRLWKRYTWLGGTRTPLIVHWPAGIRSGGEVRDQFCHAVDLAPTLLDVCGVAQPEVVDGVAQQRVDGASLARSFEDAGAPSPRDAQYFEMLGSRSIYLDGWKATTDHVSQGVADEERLMEGSRSFDDDRWELFRLDDDFSEAHDVAAEHPDVVDRLVRRWQQEAEANNVLPLEDSLLGRLGHILFPAHGPLPRSVFRPGGSPIPDEAVPRLFLGGRISASVDAPPGAEGVLCALGDWSNGFALFVQEGRLTFSLCIGGEVTDVVGVKDLPTGPQTVSCGLSPDGGGTAVVLYHGDHEVGAGRCPHPVPPAWQHGGTALCLGYDRGFPVSERYRPPYPWTGVLHEVVVEATRPGAPRPDAATVRGALRAD